ncbi:hypothetical protein B0H66DRAFT_221399 [Apodospora peruviana]|uniref:Rhodopsin domain-containing protein n=1 Tax=Apodospora peruviana TaxID=516989 RepID=A0AAE0I3M4_9PEZI|nr:hypothetical protein B0H66DRAFT_221399 [Apodospora peruviana]
MFFGYSGDFLCKAAVAFFLVQLSVVSWHRYLLLALVIPTGLYSVGVGIMYAVCFGQVYSPVTVRSTCIVKTFGPGNAFFGIQMVVDLFLSLFPWYMFHDVQMKRSKMILVCSSLSLGVFAAGNRIALFYMMISFKSGGDTTTHYYLGSIEHNIFFVCVSVPALLPLWRYLQSKRRERKAGAAQGVPIPAAGGGNPDKDMDRKKPDSIIRDPRMEGLLIEIVPTQHSGVHGQILSSANSPQTAKQVPSPQITVT